MDLRASDCYLRAVRHRRQVDIVRRLRAGGTVSVEDLARELDVSAATIRRDLQQLDRAGALTRVHGGAHLSGHAVLDSEPDRPFAEVAASHAADKDQVARLAARMVRDGEVLLLDIGTTTMMLARRLRGRAVTVMTASLAVVDVLRDDDQVELVVLGGALRRPYLSLVGVLTQDALGQVRADRAFLGASGVRADGQVLDTTGVEVPVKRALIAAADQVVLLADRHKLPGSGSLRVCALKDIDVLVTNDGADPATLDACAAAGVEVLRS
jgi:DeoR/GlpR family transcriptional regulator of sugar metabolism